MSEPQTETEQETDAEPTPGPWRQYSPHGNILITSEERTDNLCRLMGSPEWDWNELKANARLIAAAGTAAEQAKEMGYDPQKAVEVLPELLKALEDGVDAAKHAEALESRHEPVMNGNGGGARPETKDRLQALKDALASAEGSGDE